MNKIVNDLFSVFREYGYYGFYGTIGTILAFVYNFAHLPAKKTILSSVSTKINKKCNEKECSKLFGFLKTIEFWAVIEIIVITFFQYCLVGLLNVNFGKLVGTGANYYGLMFCSPVIVATLCLILKIDLLKQMDLITPAYPLALVFVKIDCYHVNCCASFSDEIPIQMIESLVALLLFFVIRVLRKKLKEGEVFPTYLILYSMIRFFTEFFRGEPETFGPLKTYQVLCIIGVVVGCIELFVAKVIREKRQLN